MKIMTLSYESGERLQVLKMAWHIHSPILINYYISFSGLIKTSFIITLTFKAGIVQVHTGTTGNRHGTKFLHKQVYVHMYP